MSTHPKLEKRRFWLYFSLLIFQCLSLFSNLVILPGSLQEDTLMSHDNALFLDLIIVLLLTGFNMYFLYHFKRVKWVYYIMVFLVFVSIGLNFTSVVMDLQKTNFSGFRVVNGMVTTISILILSYSFFVAVRDIFGSTLRITEKLLGAANIYLLIGSIFAFFYALLNILIPGSIIPNENISNLFNECVIKSSYILSYRDLPELDIPGYMHNVMIFESLFAHLFAVFIVGRLLAR